MPAKVTARIEIMDCQCRARVFPLGRLEGRHAIGNGLDPGHGRAARTEGAEDDEQGQRPCPGQLVRFGRNGFRIETVHGRVRANPTPIMDEHTDQEEIGRHGENEPDSRIPRRLRIVTSTMKAMPSPTLCVRNSGNAEIRAATDAAIETATVKV